MKKSWKRLLAVCCGVCMSVFAGFALVSCKDPEDESSSSAGSHQHAWNAGEVTTPNTCTTDGEKLFTCTTCGETRTEAIPAAHDYTVTVEEKTCESHGLTAYDCKNCDEGDYTEITEVASGHNTVGATWEVINETTVGSSLCTAMTTEATTCKNEGCGATVTRTITEVVHRGYTSEITTQATCSQNGVVTYTCSCGAAKHTTEFEGVAHAWDNGTTENGVTTYTCAHNSAHTKQTVTATRVDNTSSQLSKSALAAVSTDTATEVAVTDNTTMQMDATLLSNLASGSAEDITFVAQELSEETLPTGVDTSRVEEGATVYNFGLQDASGNNLFTEGKMTVTVPYELEEGEDPASVVVLWLKEDGNIEEIKAIYDVNAQTATFTLDHFSYYTVVRMTPEERCARDGHQNVSVVVPNDCLHGGYTLTVCAVCAKEERTNITNPTGHNYVATVVAPTCMEKGYTRHACSNAGCQESYVTNYVEKAAHTYVDTVVEPTCLDQGYTKHTCSLCGWTYRDSYVETKAHAYENDVCKDCGKSKPADVVNANNFYFNLIQSVAEQDRLYLEVEDMSFTTTNKMDGKEQVVSSEVDMFRFAFKLDENGYIVGQGEGKVKSAMGEKQGAQTMSEVMEFEVIVVFQNGKIYMFEKGSESTNGQVETQTLYSMTPQEAVDLESMKAMYEQVFGDSLTNILEGIMTAENSPLNAAIAKVIETAFVKTETADGYTFTANYDALPALYDALTEKTVAEAFDSVFGEGAYVKTYNYIYALPEKKVSQVQNDIVAWCATCGVNIEDVYVAIDGLVNLMMTMGPQSGPSGGSSDGPVASSAPVVARSAEEAESFSIEAILTQMKDVTIAEILDQMTGAAEPGLENYKAMIAQMGAPETGMLTTMSVSEIVLAMGGGEEEMLAAIEEVLAFVEEQITSLVTSLEGTVKVGFTTDKAGNLLTLECDYGTFEHEIALDEAILALISGGEAEGEASVEITASGTLNVVMGGSYMADFDHIIAALEKSTSAFNITEMLTLSKKHSTYIDKDQEIEIDYTRNYVLVPVEQGIMYAAAFDLNVSHSNPYDTQNDTYNGQSCISYKLDMYNYDNTLLFVPEEGIAYSDSCNGWKEYRASAYYCYGNTVYKVYATQAGTVLGYELCVEDMLSNMDYDAYVARAFYYNASLNKYSLDDPHNWVLTESKIPQKCEERGYHKYRCTVCGKQNVESLYKSHETEHSYQLVKPGTTCAEGVKEVYTCKVCGEVAHEYTVSSEYAAEHPTYEVTEDLPGATSDTCPEHYIRYYICACGENKEKTYVGYHDGYGNFSYLGSVEVGNGKEGHYAIYRCAVNGCGYTYAREEKYTYNEANCTVLVEQSLYAGITYNDATKTITDFGKKYAYSYTNPWHSTTTDTTIPNGGNIFTRTTACEKCGKTISYSKYQKFDLGNGDWIGRTLEEFNYQNKSGFAYEYDAYCNATYYSLYLKDGQIVRGEGRPEGTRHCYNHQTITEPTCSQFGLELRTCAACGMDQEYKTVGGHNFTWVDGDWECIRCGVQSENGSSGAFIVEDMAVGNDVKVGYLNKYSREFTVHIFVNYDADNKTGVELVGGDLFTHTREYRNVTEYMEYYWARECGIITLDMSAVMQAIANQQIANVQTISVIFQTTYNYEAEGGEGATEYGIHFEIGKAGTYKLAGWAGSNGAEPDTSVDPDDFVIVLNSDFTFEIFTNNGVQAFASEGTWKATRDGIRLYDEYGNREDINANLVLWNEYGYWYFNKVA